MPSYIRIINRPYWPNEDEINSGVEIGELNANTITIDLRSKDNTLSLWRVDNEDEAVLAIASGLNKLNDIFTLKLDEKALEDSGLRLENEKGNTIVKDINKFHYNIKDVTYNRLGQVSNIIIESLKNDDNLKSYIIDDIIIILRKAIEEGRIKEKSLHENVRLAIQQKD